MQDPLSYTPYGWGGGHMTQNDPPPWDLGIGKSPRLPLWTSNSYKHLMTIYDDFYPIDASFINYA